MYLVAEGQDGNGKAVVIDAIKEHYIKQNKKVLDLRELWQGKDNLLTKRYGTTDIIPAFKDLPSADALFLCQPTFAGIGLEIRKKHLAQGNTTPPQELAEYLAKDRQELLEKLIIPALGAGVDIFSERDRTTSYVFQVLQGVPLEIVKALPGNVLSDQHPPDAIIILEVEIKTALERLRKRDKKDACKFEIETFQEKVKAQYLSQELKSILENCGSTVIYINTNDPRTVEDTKKAALAIVEGLIHAAVKERYLY